MRTGVAERKPTVNVSLAFYHACRRYPGGIAAVAHLMGMSPDVLQKKLSPTCATHHLMVDEAEAITQLINDPAGAIELARVAGLACVPMPREAHEGTLMKDMSDIGKEFSDLLNAFNDAVRDNLISPNECDRFQREAIELFAKCMSGLGQMRALAASRATVVPLHTAA
jgi:hypothetical protein